MANIPERKNIMWTPEMDSILIKFLHDEAVSGNKRCDNGWKSPTLKAVVNLVAPVYGSPLMAKNVRSRLKTMKKEYGIAKTCLDLSGFTFNRETKLIEGDDIAWADYLRAYPKSAFLKTRMLPYYDEMVMIFGKDTANGSNHLEALDVDTETDNEFFQGNVIEEIFDTGDEGTPFPPVTEAFTTDEAFTPTDGEGFVSDIPGPSGSKLKRRRGPGSNGPARRSRSRFTNGEDPEIKQSFITLAQAAKDIAQAFKSPEYDQLAAMVEQLPMMSDEDVMAAMDLFSSNKEHANVFLGLPDRAKSNWLRKKIGWNSAEFPEV